MLNLTFKPVAAEALEGENLLRIMSFMKTEIGKK